MPTSTFLSPVSLGFLGERLELHLQGEHRKRHANATFRGCGMAGRRNVERHSLSGLTAHWCSCSKQQFGQFSFTPEDAVAEWRAVLGGTVALYVRSQQITNPRDCRRVQRRKEVRTARRAPTSSCCVTCDANQDARAPKAIFFYFFFHPAGRFASFLALIFFYFSDFFNFLDESEWPSGPEAGPPRLFVRAEPARTGAFFLA